MDEKLLEKAIIANNDGEYRFNQDEMAELQRLHRNIMGYSIDKGCGKCVKKGVYKLLKHFKAI